MAFDVARSAFKALTSIMTSRSEMTVGVSVCIKRQVFDYFDQPIDLLQTNPRVSDLVESVGSVVSQRYTIKSTRVMIEDPDFGKTVEISQREALSRDLVYSLVYDVDVAKLTATKQNGKLIAVYALGLDAF